jgi:hypothetical protein
MKRLLVLLAACGGSDDPCEGHAGACITLDVDGENVERIDQLELDVLYDGVHGTTTTQPSGGGTIDLPFVVAVDVDLTREAQVGIVAAGKLAGTVLGTSAASTVLASGGRATLSLVLAPPQTCTAGTFYCGGDKLAGDAQTLYQCNAGGVPLARGVCANACAVKPADDDTCKGTGGCMDGGFYCGGDKLDGDPQTLYRCATDAGTAPRVCPNGCVIAPSGTNDHCR